MAVRETLAPASNSCGVVPKMPETRSVSGGKRVLIFIVAYNAEKTIQWVLGRIPAKQLPPDTEVLVIDDSSADKTFEAARVSPGAAGGLKLTVLRNPVNQGYGGNQKLGYEYAIRKGFDVVALVHGDGQYAPEKLPELLAPVLNGEAEACFGSRMMERGAALRHGMPLYKYVGNRILTIFQNRALHLDLSEFHSGYRVYSVAALKELPFQCNTNDFHFDTEIIIQFALRGLRIKELPIPTYYGTEICRVNGMKYAWNVVMATLASRVHRLGIMYQRKYDVGAAPSEYDAKFGYASSHTAAVDAVPPGSTVLDLGCGPGHVARALRQKGCRVTGMDVRAPNPDSLDRFIIHDLNLPTFPEGLGTFDCVLALDCVEHLDSPEGFLDLVRSRCYSDRTRVVMTVPNVAFIIVRFMLLIGRFDYGRQGILDLTHKRLFTYKSFRRLLAQQGYVVKKLRGIPAPFPKALGDWWFSRLLLGCNRIMIAILPGLFSYQIYAEARMLPTVEHLLTVAIEASGEK